MPTTVDRIRRALEKRDGIAEEDMRTLAEAFREQVERVNQRLDDGVMLLRKGLRSEAIQRVEMTPNALDAAAELEFPEWDEWNEILQFMAIPLPPKLNQDYVAQINEAIIESLPLDALLRRHRRLAIAKAPLSVRLRTLRQIARVDSSNTVWMDDIESWEKTRLSQIDSELKRALEIEDSQTLFFLNKELKGGPWRVTPSSRLIEQTSFAAEAHLRDSQDAELRKLAPKMSRAFEARDEQKARDLRNQWQATRARFNLSVPSALEAEVNPAIQWLEDLDRQSVMERERQSAVDNLSGALTGGGTIQEVQTAYEQAKRFGEPLPENLTKQVEELSSKPAREARRKSQLAGIIAVAAVAVIGIGGYIFFQSSREAKRVSETLGQLRQFVDSGQYEEAISFYDTVAASNPSLAADPAMTSLVIPARKAVEKEQGRKNRFDELLSLVTNDDPSQIDDLLLPQLAEMAVSDREKSAAQNLQKRRSDYLAKESMRQSDEMIGKVKDLQSQFSQLRSRGTSVSNRDALQQLLTSVVRLSNGYPKRSRDASARQETLRAQISSTIKEMKDRSMVSDQRSNAIDSLANCRSLSVFADRLRDFSTQSVSRTGFIEFPTVLNEEDHWADIDRTNVWLSSLSSKLANGLTATEAANLIDSGKSLQADISPNPAFTRMRDFYRSMDEIVGRRLILDRLFIQLDKHPLSKVVTLSIESEDSDEVTDYLIYKTFTEENADRMKRSGSLGIPVVSDALGGVRNRAFQGPLSDPEADPMKAISDLVNQKGRLAVDFDQQWEQTFLEQVSSVLRQPKLDGRVKEWLIYYLLDAASRGSSRLSEMIPLTMQTLERRSDVRERWYEPRPQDRDLNPEVKRFLQAELNVAYKRFESPLKEFSDVASDQLKWIGFLSKSLGGETEFHARGSLPEYDGTLYVAAPSSEGSVDTSIYSVGKLTQGHVQLTPNPVHKVPGRPVFLFPN